jgi:hypothetical protein
MRSNNRGTQKSTSLQRKEYNMGAIAIIKRDNKGVDRIEVKTGGEILKWFHNRHSFSMSWALRYEGYSYEIIEG